MEHFIIGGSDASTFRPNEKSISTTRCILADVRAIIGTENETSVVEKIYGRIAVRDFLHEVSIKHAENIAVLPVSGIEWADLEKPHEVSTASSLC